VCLLLLLLLVVVLAKLLGSDKRSRHPYQPLPLKGSFAAAAAVVAAVGLAAAVLLQAKAPQHQMLELLSLAHWREPPAMLPLLPPHG